MPARQPSRSRDGHGRMVSFVERDVSPREVDQAVELATERVGVVQETFASELEDGSVRPDLATEVTVRAEDLDVLAEEARERLDEQTKRS
jgi:hypothetical protein